MEVPAFASLAQVGILLVPVGLIAQPAYETYASELRSFESIRLVEIPVDTKDANGIMFPFFSSCYLDFMLTFKF